MERRIRTGRRLYGGNSGVGPGESVDETPIVIAESSQERTGGLRGDQLATSDTDERLFGVAQISERESINPEELKSIRVLIVDDHAILRDGIVALLETEKDIEIVGQAENGREAVDMVRQESPDVVLMDIAMPLMNGLEATRVIKASGWPGKILMLSQYDDKPIVAACGAAGACGFLPKKYAGPLLLEGIRAVRQGQEFYVPPVAQHAGREGEVVHSGRRPR